ncbi:hypothetical protein F4802DRAFT_70564 [Xylaria palmicola]|nr:hypothetical protein F4802DRAFT_70564 [Xylaria palmicola]
MQALPCVQVRDLPPSASFYSAVCQPLGLRFVSANSASIVFGNPDPTFEVKAGNALKPTRIVLSARSPSAVSAFHAAAKRANPGGNSHILLKEDDGAAGESRASVTDLEGNVMEIVYTPSSGYAGSTLRQTQSTTKRVNSILGWNLDVASSAVGAARSAVGSATPSRPGMATAMPAGDESYRSLRRSFTSSTVESVPPQENASKGLSTGAMVGTMLGAVAAGAAVGAGITYAFIRKERDRAPRQEFEAPPFQRRATYPEPHPDQQPRYVELERTVEKVRYPEQYPPGSNKYAHPAYTTRQPPASSPPVEEVDDRPSHAGPGARSGESPRKPLMITDVEHRSNVGSQHPSPPPPPPPPPPLPTPPAASEAGQRSRAVESRHANPKSQLHAELFKRQPKARSHAPSQAPDGDGDGNDDDARSHASSSRSKHRSHRHHHHHHHHHHHRDRGDRDRDRDRDDDEDRRSRASSRRSSVRPPDAETYVSARSEKSSTSTVRPARSSRSSKAPSRAPSYVSAREAPSPPRDPAPSPPAAAADDDDDDKASVAPSDSISCIGEERPKPHARDIPFLQTRERLIIQ